MMLFNRVTPGGADTEQAWRKSNRALYLNVFYCLVLFAAMAAVPVLGLQAAAVIASFVFVPTFILLFI